MVLMNDQANFSLKKPLCKNSAVSIEHLPEK